MLCRVHGVKFRLASSENPQPFDLLVAADVFRRRDGCRREVNFANPGTGTAPRLACTNSALKTIAAGDKTNAAERPAPAPLKACENFCVLPERHHAAAHDKSCAPPGMFPTDSRSQVSGAVASTISSSASAAACGARQRNARVRSQRFISSRPVNGPHCKSLEWLKCCDVSTEDI